MMYKFCFYVPESHLESVKTAVFEAGAGTIGDYEYCCWQVLGQGQFKPLPDSQPFIGKSGKLEAVAEYKVEMVCDDNWIQAAVDAFKSAHPYEEPAYQIWRLEESF